MTVKHELVPCIYLMNGSAVTGFGQKNLFGPGDPAGLASFYCGNGADRILVFDFSNTDGEHDRAIDCLREICRASLVPVAVEKYSSSESPEPRENISSTKTAILPTTT